MSPEWVSLAQLFSRFAVRRVDDPDRTNRRRIGMIAKRTSGDDPVGVLVEIREVSLQMLVAH